MKWEVPRVIIHSLACMNNVSSEMLQGKNIAVTRKKRWTNSSVQHSFKRSWRESRSWRILSSL